MQYIPCQNCGKMLPDTWRWYRCEKCGYRICIYCLDRHRGNTGGASSAPDALTGR